LRTSVPMVLLCQYQRYCSVSTNGIAPSVPMVLLCQYQWYCSVSTNGIALSVPMVLLCQYQWYCSVSTNGIALSVPMVLLRQYQWYCSVSTNGIAPSVRGRWRNLKKKFCSSPNLHEYLSENWSYRGSINRFASQDVTPCILVKDYECFRRSCCLNLQFRRRRNCPLYEDSRFV